MPTGKHRESKTKDEPLHPYREGDIRTLVVKIGTALLSNAQGFEGAVMEGMVRELADLKNEHGLNILIVSSGAVGCGMRLLGMKSRPKALPLKQAAAAVGQSRLMHYYETLFDTYGNGLRVAQVLLSARELDNRTSYLNFRNTVKAIFDLGGVIPIVNENDTVTTDELRFGDNDTLAARIAAKIDADLCIILSDVDGLFDKNPSRHTNATLIPHVDSVTPEIEALAGGAAGEHSVGGMLTKLEAARITCAAGVPLVIANGRKPGVIHSVLAGEGQMTSFGTPHRGMSMRKRWIAFGRTSRGQLQIDDGACRALLSQGRSLLAAGITAVSGSFEMGDSVQIMNAEGRALARGLVNYSSTDVAKIMGRKSREIHEILGHQDFDEVVHRDNLVLL